MKINHLILRFALGVTLIVLALFSALPMVPPRAVQADSPAGKFSARRAMADLQVIAAKPHEAGSEAQAQVREYIVSQVETLGLQASIEGSSKLANILVLLPGSDPTRRVLITGHYDSHSPAPGAGDNGISVAAMLESLRVLRASPQLRNDVLFLFTDGEEAGWLGALDYLFTHPEAKAETGVVLCFDALPGNGPLSLQETSPGDAWFVRQMAGLPLTLYARSWFNREERGEIDTDCSHFARAGFITGEFENAESGMRYHTPEDTVEAISPHLVQGFGRTMVNLAKHFGSIAMSTPDQDSDQDFFTLPLVGLVAHPGWLIPVLSGVGLVALLVFVVLAWRKRRFTLGRFGLSILGFLGGIVVLSLAAQLIWGPVKDHYTNGRPNVLGFEASTGWLVGMTVVTMALMVVLLAFLSHRLGAINLLPASVVVYLLVWFAVHLAMDADHPLTTAYVAFPFLGGIAGMGVLLFTRHPAWKVVSLALCGLVILSLQVPQLWLASYTREDAWIVVLAACIPVGFFAPQIEAIFGKALEPQNLLDR